MLRNNRIVCAAIMILSGIIGLTATPAFSAGDVATMSIDELKSQLGNDQFIVLDVRTGRDWSSSEFKIQGARRTVPRDFDQWSADLPKDKTVVLYCA